MLVELEAMLSDDLGLRSAVYSRNSVVESERSLNIPVRYFTVYGSRAFSDAARTLWHSLPANITNAASLTAFRNRLETFIFHHTPSGCSAD